MIAEMGEYVTLKLTEFFSKKEEFMAYAIGIWISVSIGFLLGAAWGGLGKKNKQYDHQQDYTAKELSSNSHLGDL